MNLIIIIATVWGISALISHIRQARLAKEQKRQREAQARLLREQRAYAQAQREETARLIALEREQLRQRKEAERERKERERIEKAQADAERKQAAAWERQRKEDERRDAQLAKHEERLLKLEQKLELAQREEEHQEEIVTAIRVDMAGLEAYVSYMKEKGLLCKGKEEELRKLNDKLYAAETKLIKARQARELCEMQMSA